MNSKQFIKEAEAIIKNYNCEKSVKQLFKGSYQIETIWGGLEIHIDPSPKIKIYSVFMRFTEKSKFNLPCFIDTFSDYENINKYSLKWNIHNSDPNYVLDLLDMRLNNLEFIKANGIYYTEKVN